MPSNCLTLAGGSVDLMPDSALYLAGFDPQRRWSGAVGEPLEVNAILLQCEDRKILLVQVDTLSAGDRLRREILTRFSGRLRDEELFLAASHTHYAPNIDARLPDMCPVDDDYTRAVAEKVCGLVGEVLAARRRPVAVQYGEGRANHGINRRCWCWAPATRYPFVRRIMGRHPNPSGPRDETVRVFAAMEDAGGAMPAGVLWNYACHPVTAWPEDCVSADYPGVVRRRLRVRFGQDLPVVFLPGFFGNLRPNRIARWPASPYYLLHRLVNGPVFGQFDAASSAAWTSTLADVVLDAIERRLRAFDVTAIECRRQTLPMRDLMEGEVDDRRLALHRVDLDPHFSLLGVSAEVVVEYATALAALLPGRTLIPVGYLDGLCAYLPVGEMIADGGMEVASPAYALDRASFRADVSELVVDAARTLCADSTSGSRHSAS